MGKVWVGSAPVASGIELGKMQRQTEVMSRAWRAESGDVHQRNREMKTNPYIPLPMLIGSEIKPSSINHYKANMYLFNFIR